MASLVALTSFLTLIMTSAHFMERHAEETFPQRTSEVSSSGQDRRVHPSAVARRPRTEFKHKEREQPEVLHVAPTLPTLSFQAAVLARRADYRFLSCDLAALNIADHDIAWCEPRFAWKGALWREGPSLLVLVPSAQGGAGELCVGDPDPSKPFPSHLLDTSGERCRLSAPSAGSAESGLRDTLQAPRESDPGLSSVDRAYLDAARAGRARSALHLRALTALDSLDVVADWRAVLTALVATDPDPSVRSFAAAELERLEADVEGLLDELGSEDAE